MPQKNFLSETRFSQAFAGGKFKNRKWGKVRIINELKQREISRFNIQISQKKIPDSEYYKTFEELAEKRMEQLASEKDLQKKRRKLADYLFSRGWESELVYGKVNEI